MFAAANLSFEPIPFGDDQFASVSAFDLLEHIPRVLNGASPNNTVFPFVRLITEVWRVLAPGGLFHAVTPCYPGHEAFTDPTHVNIIPEHARIVAAPTLRQSWDRWRREKRGKLVYFLWELEAQKAPRG